MTHKTILNRLDDSVQWTGIPALAAGNPRRRPLRRLSTFALLLAVTGFVIALSSPAYRWIGFPVLMLGFALSNFMPIFGPIKPWGSTEPIDERERAARAKAHLIACSALAATAIFGLWLIIGLSFTRGSTTDTLRWSILDLTFLLTAIYVAGPTCFASWAERPVDDEA